MRIPRGLKAPLFTFLMISGAAWPLAASAGWLRSYGPERRRIEKSVARPDGGFVHLGLVSTSTWGPAWLVTTGPAGEVDWERTYDHDDRHIVLTGLDLMSDGGVVVSGAQLWWTGEFWPADSLILRLGPGGLPEWQVTHGLRSTTENRLDLAVLADDSIVSVGRAGNASSVLRLASDGSVTWNRSWRALGTWFRKVFPAGPQGTDLMVFGLEYTGSQANLIVAYMNELGDLIWQRAHAGGIAPGPTSTQLDVDLTGEGDFCVVTESESFAARVDSPSTWLLKLDADGNALWGRMLGDGDSPVILGGGVAGDGLGGCTVAGWQWDPVTATARGLAFGFDGEGSLLWQKAYGDEGTGESVLLTDALRTADDQTVLVGVTRTAVQRAIVLQLEEAGEVSPDCAYVTDGTIAVSNANPGAAIVNLREETDGSRFTGGGGTIRSVSSDVMVVCEEFGQRPPDEVSFPGATTPLRFDGGTNITWEEAVESGSTAFDLYRGELVTLGQETAICLWPGLSVNAVSEPDRPPIGSGWYYLVGGRNIAGAGPMGADSSGALRTIDVPCP